MNLNERQIDLRTGGNFNSLKDYLDKVLVKQLPFNENYSLTPSNNNVMLIKSDLGITGEIYIDGTNNLNGNGDIVAKTVTSFTAGTASASATDVITDIYGSVLNLVKIRQATTHDPITYQGREVYGLIQCANGTSDHDSVNTTLGSENLQISFVYYSSGSVLTLVSLTDTIEFHLNKAYKNRNTATIELENSARDVDIIIDTTSFNTSIFTITNGTTSGNSILTLSNGTLTNSGTTTKSGDTIIMANVSAFNLNTFIVLDNGFEMIKGVDVSFSSEGNIQITRQLDTNDVIVVKNKA